MNHRSRTEMPRRSSRWRPRVRGPGTAPRTQTIPSRSTCEESVVAYVNMIDYTNLIIQNYVKYNTKVQYNSDRTACEREIAGFPSISLRDSVARILDYEHHTAVGIWIHDSRHVNPRRILSLGTGRQESPHPVEAPVELQQLRSRSCDPVLGVGHLVFN